MYTKSLVLTLLTAVIHATKIKDTTTNTTDTIKVENSVLQSSTEDVMDSNKGSSAFDCSDNYNMNDNYNNS